MLGSTRQRNSDGYTVVELITVMVVLGIILVPLSVITIDFMGAMVARNVEARLATESQILLRSITEELRVASSVRSNATNTDAHQPPGGWTTANANLILVISTPVLDSVRNFVLDPLTGLPMQNEIIYFADGKNLYRRKLAHPSAPGNTMVTTCPTALVTATCPADTELTSHFEHMDFVFYDQDNSVTTDISQARSILMTVQMKQPTYGRDASFINKMRMTLRNTL